MKRITLWLLSTVSAVVLLFGYHTSTSSQLATSSGTTYPSGTTTDPTGTVTGDVAQTQWGPVQVELTVASGEVTGVTVLQQPSGNPRDEEINSYALPVLVQETLDAQSTQIDMVSGATVTSVGYLQSLQSALDRADL
jgi:uncharacterized protein with FMN-binding domain